MMTLAILFVVIAAIGCTAAVLALLGIGQLGLSGAAALERDGLARGRSAPRWTLPDQAGTLRSSPPAGPLQLIIFADHSLKSFRSVVAGLRALVADADLEIVVLARRRADQSVPILAQLGLTEVPVVSGSRRLYGSYNVRVMPFAIFIDSAGLVRGSSLVNHDWQLAKLRQVAAIPLDTGVRTRRHRRHRRHRRPAQVAG